MMDNIYIQSHSSISPQPGFEENIFEHGTIPLSGNRFSCIEPDYSKLIDPKKIRRMSRIIRMSVAAAIVTTRNAGITSPDSVVVGTSLGCLDDTDSFLSKMVSFKEDMLSPTAFIHSTHNTIASQIALHFQCYGYNSTYVHKSVSFESALLDAVMLLNENPASNILVGGADEIIDNSFTIMNRLGMIRNEQHPPGEQVGFASGEGASFFMLSDKKSTTDNVRLKFVETLSFCSIDEAKKTLTNLLNSNNEMPDLILSGKNGDTKNDAVINDVLTSCCPGINTYAYKDLCGEYGTSSAFGLWLATEFLKSQTRVSNIEKVFKNGGSVKKILLYNQLQGIHHSFMLLEKC